MDSTNLKTKRLDLFPFNKEFLSARYVNWLNDSEVVLYSEQRHHQHNLESCRSYVNSFEGSPNYLWAIVAKDTSLGHIGNISAYVDKFNQVADVGILIGEKACWGKGYGSEAWKAVLDFLIFELKLRKVTAGTMSLNQGMINIALKCGMKEEGRRKSQFLYNGSEADLVMFALFRAVC